MSTAPRHFKNAKRSAYILMEVMLATGIFALAGVSLAVALRDTISAGGRVERETHVVWNLESQLNQARTRQIVPGRETAKPDAEGVVYEKEIISLNLQNDHRQPLANLYNIRITARWKEEGLDRDLEAQTYVYQP